jgi:hypothetical protein
MHLFIQKKRKKDQKMFSSCEIKTHFRKINIISCVLFDYIDILHYPNNSCDYTVPNTAYVNRFWLSIYTHHATVTLLWFQKHLDLSTFIWGIMSRNAQSNGGPETAVQLRNFVALSSNNWEFREHHFTTLSDDHFLLLCYKFTILSGFRGLEVACWPLVPGFSSDRSRRMFRAKKSSARLPSEGM